MRIRQGDYSGHEYLDLHYLQSQFLSHMHPFHALFHNPQELCAHSHNAIGEYGGIDLEYGIAELGKVGHQPGGRAGISAEELCVLWLYRNYRYVLLSAMLLQNSDLTGSRDWRLWA